MRKIRQDGSLKGLVGNKFHLMKMWIWIQFFVVRQQILESIAGSCLWVGLEEGIRVITRNRRMYFVGSLFHYN